MKYEDNQLKKQYLRSILDSGYFFRRIFMESAILKVLEKDQEAKEKISSLNNLGEKYKEDIEKKQKEMKEKIWEDAFQYVAKEKEALLNELNEGETMNKDQSEQLQKQLEKKFAMGKEKWEEELISRVTQLMEESDVR